MVKFLRDPGRLEVAPETGFLRHSSFKLSTTALCSLELVPRAADIKCNSFLAALAAPTALVAAANNEAVVEAAEVVVGCLLIAPSEFFEADGTRCAGVRKIRSLLLNPEMLVASDPGVGSEVADVFPASSGGLFPTSISVVTIVAIL